MKKLHGRVTVFMVVVLMVICSLTVGNASGNTGQDRALSFFYASKDDGDLRLTASLIVADPFADCVYVAVRASYLHPVNYEIDHFHVYLNDLPVQELLFVEQVPAAWEARSAFSGIIALPDEGVGSLEIVPVILSGSAVMDETEEVFELSLRLTDFVQMQ